MQLNSLINQIRHRRQPQAWLTNVVILIWKRKGDKANCSTYRPIRLVSLIFRIVEKKYLINAISLEMYRYNIHTVFTHSFPTFCHWYIQFSNLLKSIGRNERFCMHTFSILKILSANCTWRYLVGFWGAEHFWRVHWMDQNDLPWLKKQRSVWRWRNKKFLTKVAVHRGSILFLLFLVSDGCYNCKSKAYRSFWKILNQRFQKS